AVVLARLIDHRPCRIAFGRGGYLDHLCKTSSPDLLYLSSSVACLAGLPLASRLSAGPAADAALDKSRDFYLSVSSMGCVVEIDLWIVDWILASGGSLWCSESLEGDDAAESTVGLREGLADAHGASY